MLFDCFMLLDFTLSNPFYCLSFLVLNLCSLCFNCNWLCFLKWVWERKKIVFIEVVLCCLFFVVRFFVIATVMNFVSLSGLFKNC